MAFSSAYRVLIVATCAIAALVLYFESQIRTPINSIDYLIAFLVFLSVVLCFLYACFFLTVYAMGRAMSAVFLFGLLGTNTTLLYVFLFLWPSGWSAFSPSMRGLTMASCVSPIVFAIVTIRLPLHQNPRRHRPIVQLLVALFLAACLAGPLWLAHRPTLADPSFSVERRFPDGSLSVALSHDFGWATIYFTTDGADPMHQSSARYSGAIIVAKNTTIRAVALAPLMTPSSVATNTFLVSYHASKMGSDGDENVVGIGQQSLPSICVSVEKHAFFGENGIYTETFRRGREAEIPCSVEFLGFDKNAVFQTDAGIRIHGGVSRSSWFTDKHSLRIHFRGDYGAKKLEFPLFTADGPDIFDAIVLRAGSSDSWHKRFDGDPIQHRALYVRDEFSRRLHLMMGGLSPRGRFVNLFINSSYWGLYNVVEYPDDAFATQYYGGRKKDWEVVKPSQRPPSEKSDEESFKSWKSLLSICQQIDAADTEQLRDRFYCRIAGLSPSGGKETNRRTYIDVENYIDYLLATFYCGNVDWPEYNYVALRQVNHAGGGFRFVVWDSERSLGLLSNCQADSEMPMVAARKGVARPFQSLMKCTRFRSTLADRLRDHFCKGGALHYSEGDSTPTRLFNQLCFEIETAVKDEYSRWAFQVESRRVRVEEWETERDRLLKDFFPYRGQYVIEFFRKCGIDIDIQKAEWNACDNCEHSPWLVGRITPSLLICPSSPRAGQHVSE